MVCPVCEGEHLSLAQDGVEDFEYHIATQRKFVYYRCDQCRSEYMWPRPTEEEVCSFYPKDYHAYHEDHGVVARMLVNMRAKVRSRYYGELLGSRSGLIFDVGSGDCRHFDALRERTDFEFAGVEIKHEIAARAQECGYDVVTGTLETMEIGRFRERCDIVSANHLLEHVIEPRVFARRSFEILKHGAYAVGQLPCNDSWERRIFDQRWAGYHFPRHLQAFSREGLRRLYEEAGFVDIKVMSVPHLQTALSVQNTLVSSGWRPRMEYGKVPIYSFLLLLAMPFEGLAYLFGKTGIVDFQARKPER